MNIHERTHHPFGFSRLGRLALCSGSHSMAQLCPEPTEVAVEGVTAAGSRVARGLELGTTVGLEEDEAELVQRVEAYLANKFEGAISQYREHYFELKNTEGQTISGGWLDAVAFFDGGVAKLVETKTGYLENRVALTAQMTAQAMAVLCNRPEVETVRAYGFNPRLKTEYQMHFTREAAGVELQMIMTIISRANSLPVILTPSGDACRYCPAAQAGICGAAHQAGQELVAVNGASIMAVEPERLGRLGDLGQVAEKMAKTIKKEIKRRIQTGVEVPGWEVEEQPGNRYIVSTADAYEALMTRGLSKTQVLALLEMPLGKARDAWVAHWKAQDDSQPKAALEREFDEFLLAEDLCDRGDSQLKLLQKGGK